jgi:hypothetical protein
MIKIVAGFVAFLIACPIPDSHKKKLMEAKLMEMESGSENILCFIAIMILKSWIGYLFYLGACVYYNV